MASVWKHARGGWYLEIAMPVGPARKIYLGKIPSSAAQSVRLRAEQLGRLARIGEPPTPELAAWLAACSPSFLEALRSAGLLSAWKSNTTPALLDWWAQYVGSRSDFSVSTRKGWQTALLHVSQRWPTQTLKGITALDAKTFSRDLGLAVSTSHAAKIIGRCSQVFAAAIDAKLITANPFSGIKLGRGVDNTRQIYVDAETARRVLDGFATLEGRALFALARWCGLRVPHEPLALTWANIDWHENRLTVPSGTKTGLRVVPLFDTARTAMAALFDSAPATPWVFNHCRASAATQWRTWALTACRTAGVQPWPKLWHNLRAACRTDLEERFPGHVCDSWLGHSERVAKDHYLRVTPDHWAAACGSVQEPPKTEPTRARGAT
jgi:integrase